MASLYNRATPPQKIVLRMIEGAARNAFHAHPRAELGPRLAKSIAKRAAGTLTSQWGSVLAASRPQSAAPSDRQGGKISSAPAMPPGTGAPAVACVTPGNASRGRQTGAYLPPLKFLHNTIGAMAGDAERANNSVRLEALRDVLRLIAREIEK